MQFAIPLNSYKILDLMFTVMFAYNIDTDGNYYYTIIVNLIYLLSKE